MVKFFGTDPELQGTKNYLKTIKKTPEGVINLMIPVVIKVLRAEGVGFEPTVPLQTR